MICVHLTEEQRRALQVHARQEVGRVSERIRFILRSPETVSSNGPTPHRDHADFQIALT